MFGWIPIESNAGFSKSWFGWTGMIEALHGQG
jgi:hypothetical protein